MRKILPLLLLCALLIPSVAAAPTAAQDPPAQVIKLIFIHHSTGENWLIDDYGGLGLELARNNYFVSDTNYGWGPDSIGDRTDIPDWLEWFRSQNTPEYMDALFNESGQNSEYTRPLRNPGGENRIIMFKSCFPNSDLEGDPDDPPTPGTDWTVGNAKYIYNELLIYFATRPDKLFVVITAPPLSSPSEPENARAFNNWLVNDWLRENDYPYNNVAVFDFYNVLTDKNAHHRIVDGQIEHILGRRDTLAYPSGDDHPSEAGSRKATEEFVPLLNYYVARWLADAPAAPAAGPTSAPAVVEPQPPADAGPAGLIDDFEVGPPAGTYGWEAYRDEATATRVDCLAAPDITYEGDQALQIDFDIAEDSWGTCALIYESPQDWSSGQGVSFYYLTESDEPFDLIVYAGGDADRRSYLATLQGGSGDWERASLLWSDLLRADWEADAGTPFAEAERVDGMAFGLYGRGTLFIDEIELIGAAEETSEEEDEGSSGLPFCGSALLLPLGLLSLLWASRRIRQT